MSLWASAGTGVLLLCSLASCDFDQGNIVTDGGTIIDAPIDTPPAVLGTSCKQILQMTPQAPSGVYMLDPDGSGPDAPVTARCDMTTEGGGWAIVFFAPSANMSTSAVYSGATARMLTDATEVMLAYRNQTFMTLPDYAVFDLPSAWRSDVPTNSSPIDIAVNVSINGAPKIATNVRFGNRSFNNKCDDPWMNNDMFGRICIVNTKAPYYSGFATAALDTCTDSMSNWNASLCSVDRRFSIAIR